MKFSDNPIFKRYLNRAGVQPARFFRRAGLATFVIYLIFIATVSNDMTSSEVNGIITIGVFAALITASIMAVGTILFIQNEERQAHNELLRLTPILPRRVIWGYVGGSLVVQRWTAMFLLWGSSLTVIGLAINAHQQAQSRQSYSPFYIQPESPPLSIIIIYLAFGSLLGSALGLTTITGAISAALQSKYPIKPTFFTIASFAMVGSCQLCMLSVGDYPDTILPIMVAVILMTAPLMIGWILARLWNMGWTPFVIAFSNTLGVSCMVAIYLVLTTGILASVVGLILSGNRDRLETVQAIIVIGNMLVVVIVFTVRFVSNWGNIRAIIAIIFLGWYIVLSATTLFFGITDIGGFTLWWMLLYLMVVVTLGFGFTNIRNAAIRWWSNVE